jgi:hypothetical protein
VLKIGLDYDDTYTADRDLWNHFIFQAKSKGHEVYLVTFRSRTKDWVEDFATLEAISVPVICTEGVAKDFYCQHFGPGKIDIWIDDSPRRVYENSGMSPEQLVEWRNGNIQSAS